MNINPKRKSSRSPEIKPKASKKPKTLEGELPKPGLSATPAKQRSQIPLKVSQSPIGSRSLVNSSTDASPKKLEEAPPRPSGVTPYFCLVMGEHHLNEGRIRMAKAYFEQGKKLADFNESESKGLIDPVSKNSSEIARLLWESLATAESMPEDTELISEESLKDDVALQMNQNLSEADFLAANSGANAKQALEFKKLADEAAAENDFPREILYIFEGLDCLKDEPPSDEAKIMFLDYINNKFQSVDEVNEMMSYWRDSDIKLTISKDEINRVIDIISRIK